MKTNLSIATMRALVIDMTNKAKSGHPGMAIGSAPILYTLYTRHLKADPSHPNWINRDRFVLSAGHASSLLYATLHLAGYEVHMEDLKKFRSLKSITPGHPEYGLTKGVDATSGPLGQGIAQAVGLALAESFLKTQYPQEYNLIDHYTYCLVGDGCLEEGISQEAISFAGLQHLNRLIVFYDANKVTLDGDLNLSSIEDTRKRFEATGWNVIDVKDGNDVEAIDKAILVAKTSKMRPTLIMVHTIIGQGSIYEGTNKVHGSPLGEEDGLRAKKSYGYKGAEFFVSPKVYDDFKNSFIKRGKLAYKEWEDKYDRFKRNYSELATNFEVMMNNDCASLVFDKIPLYKDDFKEATRVTSGKILELLYNRIPCLVGGSADVTSSLRTKIKGSIDFSIDHREGRYINYGIREFAMASIQNGILLHGGLRSYIGCFLVFSDYLKPAIRMAAMSSLPAIYVLSHDSIALGEDGATHQPIEQLAMLRSIPNIEVYRPCDAREVAMSYQNAFRQNKYPVCIILSRQDLPLIGGSDSLDIYKGGYIISKEIGSEPDVTLIATGSEVQLAIDAQRDLRSLGIDVRVVSMPCSERFFKQDPTYISSTLGVNYEKRMVIEMLSSFGWHKIAPHVMSLDTFGLSAPMKDLLKYFNFTKEEVVKRVKEII